MVRKFFIMLLSFLLVSPSFGFTDQRQSQIIGNIIKNALEQYHYRNIKIDDVVSKKAFVEFFKKLDYGKQIFLKSDIEKLKKFEKYLDDEMVTGKIEFLKEAKEIYLKRVKEADTYRKEIFQKPFDFKIDEYLEVDFDKRDYEADEKSLKEFWRKYLKHDVLGMFLISVEEQEGNANEKSLVPGIKKSKKKAKKKTEKKLSLAELQEKAVKSSNEKFEKFFKRLLEKTDDDYLEDYLNSITEIFDPHTNYFPPEKKEDFDIDISGSLEGIGAVLQEDGNYIKVVEVVIGGAAWKQKELQEEDIILNVTQENGEKKDLVGVKVNEAVRYIRGPKGSKVRLYVKRVDGTRKLISITRDVVNISATLVRGTVIENKKLGIKVGLVVVPKFYRDFTGKDGKNCTEDVREELNRLKKENVDGVILDLRTNGGGALEDARKMSGLFIKEGPIVQIRDHTGKIESLEDDEPYIMYKGPVIVLINRFSASASEIVAAALQDYKRAIIVGGEYSHGKGTVQAVLNLDQAPLTTFYGKKLGALKVTIQKFYRVTGVSTQFKGVSPDIILADPLSYTKNREQDLENALPWDRIPGKNFKVWDGKTYPIEVLKKRSEERTKSNPLYVKFIEGIKYLEKKRDETKFTLNMDKVKKEEEINKKLTESFKVEKENEDLMVSNFEDSLNKGITIAPSDKANFEREFKDRKNDFIKSIRTDLNLIEAINIIKDMVMVEKGEKLTMR
jgi:carboxyl-terminal processing protease